MSDEREAEREAPAPKGEPAAPSRRQGSAIAVLAAGLVIALLAVVAFRAGKSRSAPTGGAGAGDLLVKLETSGRSSAAKRVREACSTATTCACRQASAHAALDADLHAEALAALGGDPACEADAKSRGMAAEALARAGKHDEASSRAAEVLKASPEEPFATYAVAHVAWSKGDAHTTIEHATQAVRRGRGAPARLLVSLFHFRAKGYEAAKYELEEMLKLDPNDVDALYNLALIAQLQNRYHEAREGYLKLLQVAPKHADSRYNLGVMTHSVGALQETRHNLERLKEIVAADDERVKKLEALLAGPPPNPGGRMVMAPGSGAPPGSAAPAPPAPSR